MIVSVKRKMAMKKRDLWLIAGAICLALAVFLLRETFQKTGDTIEITVDGELYGTYSLKEDQTILINDTNTCQIQNGQAKMIQADCPDHLCMKQKAVTKEGGTITCLPNRVVIQAEQSADGAVDTVAGVIW